MPLDLEKRLDIANEINDSVNSSCKPTQWRINLPKSQEALKQVMKTIIPANIDWWLNVFQELPTTVIEYDIFDNVYRSLALTVARKMYFEEQKPFNTLAELPIMQQISSSVFFQQEYGCGECSEMSRLAYYGFLENARLNNNVGIVSESLTIIQKFQAGCIRENHVLLISGKFVSDDKTKLKLNGILSLDDDHIIIDSQQNAVVTIKGLKELHALHPLKVYYQSLGLLQPIDEECEILATPVLVADQLQPFHDSVEKNFAELKSRLAPKINSTLVKNIEQIIRAIECASEKRKNIEHIERANKLKTLFQLKLISLQQAAITTPQISMSLKQAVPLYNEMIRKVIIDINNFLQDDKDARKEPSEINKMLSSASDLLTFPTENESYNALRSNLYYAFSSLYMRAREFSLALATANECLKLRQKYEPSSTERILSVSKKIDSINANHGTDISSRPKMKLRPHNS